MKIKAIILFTVIFLYIISAVSCTGGTVTVSSPLPPTEEVFPDVISPETVSTPSIEKAPEKTGIPAINHCHNTEPDLISIGGICEEGSEITVTSPVEKVTVTSSGKYFLASVRIPVSDTPSEITVSAKAPGKYRSEAVTLSASYSDGTYLYDDEWHILTGNASRGFARSTFADYEGTNLLTREETEVFKKRIKEKTDFLSENLPGCELIYMIVPNPLTVYSEQAPMQLKKAEGKTRLDQVIETINSTDAVAIDLRPVMNEHKNDALQPYLYTDSHWSEYGAYLGLGELCDYISKEYPEAKIRHPSEYGFEVREVDGGDIIHYLGMDNTLQRESVPFFNPSFKLPVTAKKYLSKNTMRMDFDATSSRIRVTTGNEKLPDCVVFRDSYGIALYEILPDRFNNTSYYHTWGYNFDKKYILNANPDYVIYIVAERNADNLIR
ncbi:MAG: hypothetical protein IJO52_02140 [Clostridia bacterium]|nr:hypothetical protein [Clostridia bacterium]